MTDPLARPLGDFLTAVAATAPGPGGGSAGAVAVAMAAALVGSVARASSGTWEEAGGAAAQADALVRRVLPLVGADAEAYQEALSTLADRDTIAPEDRDARIAETLERAAEVPMEIGEAAADAAELAALTAESGAAEVRADAASAAVLAHAAARTVAMLVEVNLTTTRDDPRVDRSRALVVRAERASKRAAAAAGC